SDSDVSPPRPTTGGLWHPSREEIDLGQVLCALADPNRLRVVAALLREEPGAARPYPWFGLPVGKAGRTHHFRVLREVGLIEVENHGNRATVRLRRADIDARFPGLFQAILAGTAPTADQRDGKIGEREEAAAEAAARDRRTTTEATAR